MGVTSFHFPAPMLPDCSAVHPFGILLIALGGENGMVDENLAAFVSTAKTVVPNSIDQSFTGGPLAFWWENNMQNSIVGIFSNGFIKLVQKTDITHSNVIVFFRWSSTQTLTRYVLLMSAREKSESYLLKPQPLFSSDTTSCDLEWRAVRGQN